MILLKVLASAVSLFFGRKLYWALAGIGGYLTGVYFVTHSFRHASSHIVLTGGIVCGIMAIVASFVIRHWIIMLVAFIAGGYFFTNFFPVFGGHLTSASFWPAFAVGGFIFAAFFMAFFELALVLATALLGAYILFEILPFKAPINIGVAGFLFLLGIKFQFEHMKKGQTQQFKKIDLEKTIQEIIKKKKLKK